MGVSLFAWQNAREDRRAHRIERGADAAGHQPRQRPRRAFDRMANAGGVVSGVLLTVTPAAPHDVPHVRGVPDEHDRAATVTARAYTNPGAVLVGTWAMTPYGGNASLSRMPTRRPIM